MALAPGTRLGAYDIVALIGSGGMGEVYRARDNRLNRDVAIKVLPADVAADHDRLARFEREAQVLASLNHPNIAQIHGVDDSSGTPALVMELVDGPTLADRIAIGPIPLDEALPIAKQIAEALEAAHEQGIIHRDLKPANIKVRLDGTVKVLDFGLAKAFDPVASGMGNATMSPTLSLHATHAGIILGTAAYMSPEQARGKAVDRRADIWAFGCVLYEMLTGRRAFDGDDISITLASVLKTDPDWHTLPVNTPNGLQHLLRRCLEKDPKRRLRDIGEARVQIEDLGSGHVQDAAPIDPMSGSVSAWRRLPWIVAAVFAVVALGATWEWLHPQPASPRAVTKSAMTLTGTGAQVSSPYFNPAVSRDGTSLVYAEASNPPRLWLRRMDQLEGLPIPGGDAAVTAAFSPDGQWIAYIAALKGRLQLKKTRVTGGTSVTLCDLPAAITVSWADDDAILLGSPQGLLRVPAAGGRPESLTTSDAKNGENGHYWPQPLPGGQAILFTVHVGPSQYDAGRIAVLDPRTRTYRVVVASGREGVYVPTGHLVYRRGSTLFAVPFAVKQLAVTGSEVPVVEGLTLSRPLATHYTVSSTGLLVLDAGDGSTAPESTIAWMDRKGNAQPLAVPARALVGPGVSLSPDGKTVAVASLPADNQNRRLWLYDTDRGVLTSLTADEGTLAPVWAPDGRSVTFASERGGKHGLYRIPADSSGPPERLLDTESPAVPYSWTPDGKTLAYYQGSQGKQQIWLLTPPGRACDAKPRRFHPDAPFEEEQPNVSPDGRWLAYVSDQSGRWEVYVSPFPGPGGRVQISTDGGRLPVWSRNGRELFYVELGPRRVMAVEILAGASFQTHRPQPLFTIRNDSASVSLSVAPDGQRFLVTRPLERATGSPKTTFVIITDWFEELKRVVPTK